MYTKNEKKYMIRGKAMIRWRLHRWMGGFREGCVVCGYGKVTATNPRYGATFNRPTCSASCANLAEDACGISA